MEVLAEESHFKASTQKKWKKHGGGNCGGKPIYHKIFVNYPLVN